MQLELEYNGVAIIGSRLRQINYSNDVTSVESLYVLRQSAYLAATSAAGGLYGCMDIWLEGYMVVTSIE